jgi:uncharacterized protein YktA (UPF0223 family)
MTTLVSTTKTADAPKPLVFNGDVERYYETKRNGITVKLYLVEVKKNKAIVKDKKEDKHSRTMPLAQFLKFYI